MDDERLQRVDTHDQFAHEHEVLEAEEHDLLDEPVLPLLGLSAATLAVVFFGGAVGTLARYLMAAHHPAGPGSFPWVTLLVNLSGRSPSASSSR
jgi:hypothetical protein